MTNQEAMQECLKIQAFAISEKQVEAMQTAIKALEQEPKTGHWKESDIPNEKYVCSECGGACWYYDYQGNLGKSNYCPNCGAKMAESEDKK